MILYLSKSKDKFKMYPVSIDNEKLLEHLYRNTSKHLYFDSKKMVDKFPAFKKICDECNGTPIVVSDLRVLGDTVDELAENIKYAIKNDCELHIVSLSVVIKMPEVAPIGTKEISRD